MHVRKFIVLLTLSTIIFALVYQDGPIAQNMSIKNNSKNKFQYLFPVPDSKLNSTETNIIIRHGEAFDFSILNDASALSVTGSKSGIHQGRIVLAEDNKTLIFYPDKHFSNGEFVTVELKENIKNEEDGAIPSLQYTFQTAKRKINKDNNFLFAEWIKNYQVKRFSNKNTIDRREPSLKNPSGINIVKGVNLPVDFPSFNVDVINEPSPGSIFFTPIIFPSSGASSLDDLLPTYLIITDNYGVPVFYRQMSATTYDFKMQRTGVLSYYDYRPSVYYIMDSSYKIIDSLHMQNYHTDLHELELLDNGHSLMMSYDPQEVAMDTLVEGGDTNAIVIGLIIQELDEKKDIVFQWRSWDHLKITDATYNYDLTAPVIDYVHGNAIEMDIDGNLLISSRHLDEITKINRLTGEIIWRWGGIHCRNNEFTFINDPIGFSHQHDIRRLPNGNLLVFDNGNLHDPPFSRVVEYQVDDVNKISTLVWEYKNNPSTYTAFMGSSRRLENGNTIIGWGSHTMPAISEVNSDGTVLLSFSLPDTLLNYRAFKSQWKTNIFTANPESLSFGFIGVGDSATVPLSITNNSTEEIEINGLYNRSIEFKVEASLPIKILPSESAAINVTFNPQSGGEYFDDLHIRWDSETEGIAQVVHLSGNTLVTGVEDDIALTQYLLKQNYPNPFNPSTKISYQLPESGFVTLKIYDVLGNEIKTLVNELKNAGEYDIDFNVPELSSGFYIYKLKVNDFVSSKKMLLMK